MWGRHVDVGLAEAMKDAKNDKAAQRKGMSFMQRIMSEPDDEQEEVVAPTKGKFRDPADKFN